MGKRRSKKRVEEEELAQINPNAAGLDIDDDAVWAAVPASRAEKPVQRFSTFTCDLHSLAKWLQVCGIKTVAMESTGVLWMPIYEILEQYGFEVYLVHARASKNVSGRKSDVSDCQWIQQLHSYGLLRASFHPDADIATMRAFDRHRTMLVQNRAEHIQHMQKALLQMNLKLTNVLRDVTGQTGMRIIRAILAGERDPKTLASHRDFRCKKSEEEIAKSLEGHYRSEHLFALKQAVELYDVYTQKIAECNAALEEHYRSMNVVIDDPNPPLPPGKRRRSPEDPGEEVRLALYRIAGTDLTQIDGFSVTLTQQVLSEIGTDMSRWPTAKHFTSWLGLAPNNEVSGGKVLRSRTKRTKSRANTAFRLAAVALRNADCALGAFYRRLRSRSGGPVAVTATARKLAVIVYHMLKHRTLYADPGAHFYEQRYKDRVIRNLSRRARSLGLELVPAQRSAVS